MFDTVVQMRPSRDERISVDPLRTLNAEIDESDALKKILRLFRNRAVFPTRSKTSGTTRILDEAAL